MRLTDRVKDLWNREGRTAEAGRQVLLSSVAKGVTILCSLLIVPLTIHYVNETQYGIWLTLSSIIAWISYFDFGLGNGFRNRFAEAKAMGDFQLAREYVSTTYFAIGGVVLVAFLLAMTVNACIDWTGFLKVDASMKDELRMVFAIVCAFFCLNMVSSIFTTLLTADQKNGVASMVNAAGQVFSLLVIWILTKISQGSLTKLALYFSGVPCVVVLIVSVFAFRFSRYRAYRPSLNTIRPALIRNIVSLGIRFFIVYLCLLVIFQMMNIVISREIGPDAVTEYNIAYKYFNVLYAVLLIILTPFWSAFTDAYTQKDFAWMSGICRKLEYICAVFIAGGGVMLALAPVVYPIWIDPAVKIASTTSLAVFIYIVAMMIGNVYMYMINGIGTIRIQSCIYIVMALIAWPLMVWSCRRWGVAGIVIAPTLACLIQAVSGRIQLHKILNGTAKGWWLK